jgi:hypothetical protein
MALMLKIQGSSVGIATGYGLDDMGSIHGGSWYFSLHHRVQTGTGPTQHPIRGVQVAVSLGVKWSGREADLSPPCSTEVKKAWRYTPTPNTFNTKQFIMMWWSFFKHKPRGRPHKRIHAVKLQYACSSYTLLRVILSSRVWWVANVASMENEEWIEQLRRKSWIIDWFLDYLTTLFNLMSQTASSDMILEKDKPESLWSEAAAAYLRY